MTRILHLSDLHFGTVDPRLEAPLLATAAKLSPDLAVISGDLTQRARNSQFRAARAFIDRMPCPVLCVPGNHDTPLDNLYLRFLRPFSRYRRYICDDLEPVWTGDCVTVAGSNSVNRFAWQRGKLSRRRLARLKAKFHDADDCLRVAVLHHPLEHDPDVSKRLMRGASAALQEMERYDVDVVLSGHLHVTVTRPFAAAAGLLFVQAGTGLSLRLRDGQANSFNLLDYDDGRLTVETWEAQADEQGIGFAPARASHWVMDGDAWRECTRPTGRLSRAAR